MTPTIMRGRVKKGMRRGEYREQRVQEKAAIEEKRTKFVDPALGSSTYELQCERRKKKEVRAKRKSGTRAEPKEEKNRNKAPA